MDRPTAPSSVPSDVVVKPVTLVGSASRHTSGCVLLSTEGGRFELVGGLAVEALKHPKVSVLAMPQPTMTSSCEATVVVVRSVTAIS